MSDSPLIDRVIQEAFESFDHLPSPISPRNQLQHIMGQIVALYARLHEKINRGREKVPCLDTLVDRYLCQLTTPDRSQLIHERVQGMQIDYHSRLLTPEDRLRIERDMMSAND